MKLDVVPIKRDGERKREKERLFRVIKARACKQRIRIAPSHGDRRARVWRMNTEKSRRIMRLRLSVFHQVRYVPFVIPEGRLGVYAGYHRCTRRLARTDGTTSGDERERERENAPREVDEGEIVNVCHLFLQHHASPRADPPTRVSLSSYPLPPPPIFDIS